LIGAWVRRFRGGIERDLLLASLFELLDEIRPLLSVLDPNVTERLRD
jgi:hypothetical protein